MADRIIVLKDGGIVEEGTHDDLVARGGLYAEPFTLQAAGYRWRFLKARTRMRERVGIASVSAERAVLIPVAVSSDTTLFSA